MDKQLSSNRDESSGGGLGGGQQKRRRDGRPSNNARPPHNIMNNANFDGNQQQQIQGWNDNRRDCQNQGRGGGQGRSPPGRGGGRGFGRGSNMNNMSQNDNNMRGPNYDRDNSNMNGPQQYQHQQGRGGRGGNMPQHNQTNQGYAQQQQRYDGQQQGRGFIPRQGRGENNMTADRGRGRGDLSGRGGGRTQQTSQTDLQKSQTPIPPSERRTLILSNIPPTLKYHQIQNHLSSVLNVQVQYCTIDQQTNEAYVRFKYVNDAIKVWDNGTEGLDGNANIKSGNNNGEGGEQISLVQLGVQLKAVHFTNFMIAQPKVVDRGQQSSGGNGRSSASVSAAGGRGGEGRGFDRKRNWDQQQGQSNGGQDTPQSSSSAAAAPTSTQSTPNYPTNTKYHRSPSKQQSQQKQLSPMEKQLQEQKQLEEQKAYEQFQIQEKEWRKRRKAEYDIFMTAKQSREAHLSTLEQKKDLLSKQESMLNSQLPLHKKMLTVLKSKNAELSEQSKKMKEILSTQTRIMEIKKEIKGLVETIEKLKQEEVTKGVFRPTEKRPIFSSADSDGGSTKKKKARLDRRTTVLKVEGFNNDVTEDAIKEHFKCCTSVSIETKDDKTVAIVNFANRVYAEKAKSSTTKFNDRDLTCTWHNLPSAASKEATASGSSNQDQTTSKDGEESTDQTAKDDDMNIDEEDGLYDDFGGDVFDIEPPADGNEEEAVDYDEDEDLVDYD